MIYKMALAFYKVPQKVPQVHGECPVTGAALPSCELGSEGATPEFAAVIERNDNAALAADQLDFQ